MISNSLCLADAQVLIDGAKYGFLPPFLATHTIGVALSAFVEVRFYSDNAGTKHAIDLQYAHGLGFIHRDLKPDNILFNVGGPLVIADWGLGYFIHRHSQVLQHLTVGGMGTEYYCSVEQWATGNCDCRGDIYSLGMTLDEWVTGRQRMINVGDGVNGPATAELTFGAQRFNALLQAMTQRSKLKRPSSTIFVRAMKLPPGQSPHWPTGCGISLARGAEEPYRR